MTVLGQIPALFNMEWRLKNYGTYDLSTLRFAIYGGQAVSRPFLEKMKEMAPRIGTGLGLTETAGFCTYTDIDANVDDLAKGIGYDMPICPISVREPMNPDGTAGAVKTGGVGEICFEGPQVFLGYLNDDVNTKKTISTDGVIYTGDLGYYDDYGLHFAGRSKLVIKPKGYQIFPEDVEKHFLQAFKGRLGNAACLGAEHNIYSEAVVLFVEQSEGQIVTQEELRKAANDLSSFSRPHHYEILKPGEMPLNRVAKTDYMTLKEKVKEIVAKRRAEGTWERD